MTRGPEADDDDLEDAPPEALTGHASVETSAGGTEVGDLLLDLAARTLKAAVLLTELDSEDFALVSGRLAAFRGVVEGMPTVASHPAPAPKVVGFRPPVRKPKARRR